jgi:transcriptional regulator with GAF, ATPase, and Fis domain
MIELLARVAAAKSRESSSAAMQVLVSRAVTAIAAHCGRLSSVECNMRAALYRLEGNTLRLTYWEGRIYDPPPQQFNRDGSRHNEELFRIAESGRTLLVEDLENSPPPHFSDPRGQTFKAFLASPVHVGGTTFGLLIVDSDRALGLSDSDRAISILGAGIIAAGFAHSEVIDGLEKEQRNLRREAARAAAGMNDGRGLGGITAIDSAGKTA